MADDLRLERAVARLNQAVRTDPDGMQMCIDNRNPVSEELAKSAETNLAMLTLMAPDENHKLCQMGPLSLLNMTLRDDKDDPILAAVYDDGGGRLTGFKLLEPSEVKRV